ncbi:hypothetical protein ABT390_16485 [Streptomyces aurantiacus]|uniref:hypothetical protein n=1 Tax=Streptomyces aurantiacus TaxID=47760 RepID=UPI00216ABB12|nr:hypothetical protein [Streptomyces aurantiacus]
MSAVVGMVLLAGCAGEGGGSAGDADGSRAPGASGSAERGAWKIAHIDRRARGTVEAVVAAAPDDIWAVGADQGAGTAGTDPYLLRHDGTKWRRTPLPAALGGRVTQPRLDASGPDNVWLHGVAPSSGSRLARWDGTRWHAVPRPSVQGAVGDLRAFAPDDVWALVGDRAAHWDGTRWTVTPLPAVATALDGTSGDDVWAVGYRDRGPGVGGAGGETTQPAAMRWDARARAWKLTPTPVLRFPDPVPPEAGASLTEVLAVSRDEVWAYGTHSFNHGESESEPSAERVLLRWDGARWREQRGADTDPCLSRPPVAHDGAGGILFDRHRFRAADGSCRKAPWRRLPATGEITAGGKQQLWFEQVGRVPGTKRFVGAGKVYVMQSGNPLTMPVVAVYEP